MNCKQCGNEIAPDAKFCGVCGAPNEPVAQPVQEAAQPAEPQYAQPQYAQPAQPAEPQYAQPQYAQPAQPAEPQYAQPQYAQPVQPPYGQPVQPQYNAAAPVGDPVERDLSKSVLIFGILSLAFCCTFYLAFVGIIFGAIAMSKAKRYAASYPLAGRAKVGKILGTVGLILAIVLTVILVFIIIAAIAATASYSSYSNYYYY